MAKSPIGWVGGKRLLVPRLLELMPQHYQTYVEPFCGGAALYFAKEQQGIEVLNDLDGGLVNFYRCVVTNCDEMAERLEALVYSRAVFNELKEQNPSDLAIIDRACRFYYINKVSFGCDMLRPRFGTSRTHHSSFNPLTVRKILTNTRIRMARVCLEHDDWSAVCKRYDHANTFFYLDPPYFQTHGYAVSFDGYDDIAQFMRTCKGKVMLSINDCPEMESVFEGFNIERVSIGYAINRDANITKGKLIVRNYYGKH